jgi:hypothetical protein
MDVLIIIFILKIKKNAKLLRKAIILNFAMIINMMKMINLYAINVILVMALKKKIDLNALV